MNLEKRIENLEKRVKRLESLAKKDQNPLSLMINKIMESPEVVKKMQQTTIKKCDDILKSELDLVE